MDLAEYNVAVLDVTVKLTVDQKRERKKILDLFEKFIIKMKVQSDEIINRFLFGHLTEREVGEIRRKCTSVEEGDAHMPGRLAEAEAAQERKDVIIIPTVGKLRRLVEWGKADKLYRSDVIFIKGRLLELLFDQFGSGGALPNLKFAIRQLKEAEMIPDDLTFLDMVQYCAPGGRY